MVRLLLVTIAFTFSLSSQASECGIFKVVKGKVEFQKKNKKKFRKARVNKKVCSGDTIKASDNARAKIEMAGGNEINISPNTQLLIEKYKHDLAKNEKKVLLNVLYGKIRSNVKQKYGDDEKSHFRVKTKSAVAGVRGTEFLTEFNRATNRSRVVTFEGEVAVGQFESGKFIAKVTVKPGQFTSNNPGTEPHPARDVPPKELARMDRESNVSGGSGRGVSNDPGKGPKKEKDKKKGPKKEPKQAQPDKKDPQAKGPEPGSGDVPPADPAAAPEGNRDPASAIGDQLPEPEPPKFDAGCSAGDCLPKAPNTLPVAPQIPGPPDEIRDPIQNKDATLLINANPEG